MKAGGGKAKGNRFELDICKALSKWITRGAQDDLFARNVISGGSFTKAAKEKELRGLSGDLMVNGTHPDAVRFLKLFAVECKHHASLDFERFFFDHGRESFLWKTFLHTQKQAQATGARPLVIARQNRRPTILLVDQPTHYWAVNVCSSRIPLRDHFMFNGQMGIFELDNFFMSVPPARFLEKMEADQ